MSHDIQQHNAAANHTPDNINVEAILQNINVDPELAEVLMNETMNSFSDGPQRLESQGAPSPGIFHQILGYKVEAKRISGNKRWV